MKKLFLILCLLVGLASSAEATNYYVATNGSNSNPGSLASPFLTPQKCANVAVAGDTCNVRAGSYPGFSAVNNGIGGSPITFTNYNSEAVYIDASLGVVSGSDGSNTVNASFRSYLVFDGLRITGNTEDSATYTGRAAIGIEMHTSDHITLQNCWVSYALGTGVGIYESAHDVTVQNCRIFQNAKSNYARPSGFDWGAGMIGFHGTYNILFKDNLIYWNHGEGVTCGDHSHEFIFDGNIVSDNWSVDLYAGDGCQNVTVKNNIIYNTDAARNINTSDLRNNPDGIALSVGDSSSSYTFDQLNLTGIRIYNNLIINTGWCIDRFNTTSGHPDSDWVIANNTCILRTNPGFKFVGGASYTNFTVKNNLLASALGATFSDWAFMSFALAPVSSSISNNLYNTTGSSRWSYNGTTYTTYASWAAASGESASLTSNPLLTNIGVTLPILRTGIDAVSKSTFTTALALTSSSPAVNAGVTVAAVTTDISGVTRPQSTAYDMGAEEFSGGGGAVASTYYVSKTGSDSHACSTTDSAATNKLTIAAGLTCLSPGDTLTIHTGTYTANGNLNPPSGTAGAHVTVKPATGETVTIQPTAGDVFDFLGTSYIDILGTGGILIIDGVNAQYSGFHMDELAGVWANHITVADCEIKNNKNNGLLLGSSGPTTGGFNQILRNNVHNNATVDFSPYGHGIYITSRSNIIDGNTFHDNDTGNFSFGIHIYNSGVGSLDDNIVRNNTVYGQNKGGGILVSNGSSNQVYNNVIYDNIGGISLFNGANASLIYNNTIYSNTTYGITVEANASNSVIQNNIEYANGTDYSNLGAGTTHDHNLEGINPIFTNAVGGNFTLLAGSPAIEFGTALPSPFNVDIIGTSRPQGSAFDAGAYEAAGGGPPPTGAKYATNTGGLNSGTCTSSSTPCTRTYLMTQLVPGNTGFFCAGPCDGSGTATYVEWFNDDIPSGTSWTVPVTLTPYPGETITFRPAAGADRAFTITGSSSKYIIIDGFILDCVNVSYDCIKTESVDGLTYANHIRIQNNEIKNAKGSGILLAGNTVTGSGGFNEVINNNIHDNATFDFSPFGDGILVTSAGNLIERNVIHDHTADTGNSTLGVHIYNGGTGGLDSNVIRKNTFYNNTKGGGVWAADGTNIQVYNNLFYNNYTGVTAAATSITPLFYNNTVYGGITTGIEVKASATNTNIRNNISFNNGTNYTNAGTGTTHTFNLDDGTDPLFTSAGTFDFTLTGPSPAVDAGTNLSATLTDDILGVPRPQGAAYDKGAYERNTTTPPVAFKSVTKSPVLHSPVVSSPVVR